MNKINFRCISQYLSANSFTYSYFPGLNSPSLCDFISQPVSYTDKRDDHDNS